MQTLNLLCIIPLASIVIAGTIQIVNEMRRAR